MSTHNFRSLGNGGPTSCSANRPTRWISSKAKDWSGRQRSDVMVHIGKLLKKALNKMMLIN